MTEPDLNSRLDTIENLLHRGMVHDMSLYTYVSGRDALTALTVESTHLLSVVPSVMDVDGFAAKLFDRSFTHNIINIDLVDAGAEFRLWDLVKQGRVDSKSMLACFVLDMSRDGTTNMDSKTVNRILEMAGEIVRQHPKGF